MQLYLKIHSVDELRKAADSSMKIEINIERGCSVDFKKGKPCSASYTDYFVTYSDSSKLNETEFQQNKLLKVLDKGDNCPFDNSRFSYINN